METGKIVQIFPSLFFFTGSQPGLRILMNIRNFDSQYRNLFRQ